MDEAISRSVVYSDRQRQRGENVYRDHTVLPPVEDRYNLVYFSMILAGSGFLLPYNSIISAVDFYKSEFPDSGIIFDITLVYILTSLLAVLLNNVLIETFTLNSRIQFGYFMSTVTLGVVLMFSVWPRWLSNDSMYALTLSCVAAISLGATVQQSSFYGYTSLLPRRYTQAVMTGESFAGVISSVNRILTKWLVNDVQLNTSIFFTITIFILLICIIIYPKVQKCAFVSFYISLARGTEKSGRYFQADFPEEDSDKLLPSQNNPVEDAGTYQLPEFGTSCRNGNSIRHHVEDVLIAGEARSKRIGGNVFKCCRGLSDGLKVRLSVCRNIIPHLLGILLTYLVTLALFPGIETEIESCKFGTWMPVILVAIFNISDLFGKMLAGLRHHWSRGELVLWPLARIILVPLLIMCAAPKYRPVITGEVTPMVLSVLLGLSNGVWGSLPMILAPQALPESQREYSGNLMTVAYSLGLTIGSLVSYWLQTFIGDTTGVLCPRMTRRIQTQIFNSTHKFAY